MQETSPGGQIGSESGVTRKVLTGNDPHGTVVCTATRSATWAHMAFLVVTIATHLGRPPVRSSVTARRHLRTVTRAACESASNCHSRSKRRTHPAYPPERDDTRPGRALG